MSSSREWSERNNNSGGGWLRESTRTRGRRKKVIRDFWTLTNLWPRFNF